MGTAYTEYVYDVSGEPLGENNTSFVPLGGGARAVYGNGATYFTHPNLIGSTSAVTDYTGATAQDQLYYPWGQAWSMVGTGQETRFASLEHRDSESSLDPTLFRMFSSAQGRWLSPDPMGGDLTNPQSLNRYAYVLNNPTNLIDPLGLDDCPAGTICVTVTAPAPTDPCYNDPKLCMYGGGVGGFNGSLITEDYGGGNPSGGGAGDGGGGGGGCGQGPTPGQQKINKVVNLALHQSNLSNCLNKIFGPGTILTNKNLPILDTTKSDDYIMRLTNQNAVATYDPNVPPTGRGTVLIPASEFYSPASSDLRLAADFIHETGNILAIQRFADVPYDQRVPRPRIFLDTEL